MFGMGWKMYKGEFLFCKPTDGRATSLEVLDIINGFLEENQINSEKWIRFCNDSPINA
jgi:hypothetical protein